ncbi:MAG: acyltransferase family protein [Rhizobiaceae bacterium]
MATATHFRTDIQGLRAIAVLTIVIFHAWPSVLPGGFTGVDVFFVISGFLIGGILQRDIAARRFSLIDFYRKRVRRIFPALFVVLTATLAFGATVLGPDAYKELARTTVSSTLFLSNVDFFSSTGYFSRAAENRPLLHTWSLSVEEQFYLLFPVALLAVYRLVARHLALVTLFLILVFLAISQWALDRSAMAAYFLSPFRGFEFLLGALAAYAPAPKRKSVPVAWIGLSMIGLGLVMLSPESAFPGVRALLPTVGTALILWAGRGRSKGRTARLLSIRPLVFFGAISYSLYLWHWPLMAFLRILSPNEPGIILMATTVLVSTLFGWLSWLFVEQRFAKVPVGQAPILQLGLSGMVALSIVGGTIWLRQGLPERFSPETLTYFESAQDYSPWRETCHQSDNARIPYRETCVLGDDTAHAPALVIWGDSHATELSAALSIRMPLRQITASACPPVMGLDFPKRRNCRASNQEILAALESDLAARTIILVINREAYPEIDSSLLLVGYRSAIKSLAAKGKTVVLMEQIPNPNLNPPQTAGAAVHLQMNPERIGSDLASVRRAFTDWTELEQELARLPQVVHFDPAPSICDGDFCPLVADGQVLYFDSVHVSMEGARRIVNDLHPFLRTLLSTPTESTE